MLLESTEKNMSNETLITGKKAENAIKGKFIPLLHSIYLCNDCYFNFDDLNL